MGKIVFATILIACLYFLHENGTLNALSSGNIPQAGKKASVSSPKGGDAYMARSKDDLCLPIDALIGMNKQARSPAIRNLKLALKQGRIGIVPDKSELEIIANGKIFLYSCMYRVVKVRLLKSGQEVWMLRDDVVDTPLQAMIANYMRGGKEHLREELEESNPYERDL